MKDENIFVTLQEISAFLYIKAVWGIEEKWASYVASAIKVRIRLRPSMESIAVLSCLYLFSLSSSPLAGRLFSFCISSFIARS